jgi:pimeloyl-ACP methyl ester carboxylesterase
MVLIDPTNLTRWPTLAREPLISDGDDGDPGYLRFSGEHGYAELAAAAVPSRPPRCVVVSSSEDRWRRDPPTTEDRWWEPLTLVEVDRLWQNYQRDWVYRLQARHVLADTAGHLVHRDQPDLVAHVVTAVVNAARNHKALHLDSVAVANAGGRVRSARRLSPPT